MSENDHAEEALRILKMVDKQTNTKPIEAFATAALVHATLAQVEVLTKIEQHLNPWS